MQFGLNGSINHVWYPQITRITSIMIYMIGFRYSYIPNATYLKLVRYN